MAIKTTVTATCDICGRTRTINGPQWNKNEWRHEVWIRVKLPHRVSPVLMLHEMDMCEECMLRQTVLAGEADGTIEAKNIRNVHFVEDES